MPMSRIDVGLLVAASVVLAFVKAFIHLLTPECGAKAALAPSGTSTTSYYVLVLRPKTRGIPETMVCRIRVFMWPFATFRP